MDEKFLLDLGNLDENQVKKLLNHNNTLLGSIILSVVGIDGWCDSVVKCKEDGFYNIGWNYRNCVGVVASDKRTFSIKEIMNCLYGAKLFYKTEGDNNGKI